MTSEPRSGLPWRWALAGAAGTVVLAAATGLGVHEIFAEPDVPATGPAALPATDGAAAEQPGSPVVQAAPDVRNHPEATRVIALLQRQFDAINTGNYTAWTTTVRAEKLADMPKQRWLEDFGTTKDGGIAVQRIDPGSAGGLVVLVSFTSVQAVEKAPKDFPYACIRWRMMYPITVENGQLRVDAVSPANVLHDRCAA